MVHSGALHTSSLTSCLHVDYVEQAVVRSTIAMSAQHLVSDSASHHSSSNILTTPVCRHEIIGIITAVGPKVKNFKVGDRAGVGCLVDSCQECEQCTQEKEEQFCAKAVQTYNMKGFDGQPTYGGYSTHYVVTER